MKSLDDGRGDEALGPVTLDLSAFAVELWRLEARLGRALTLLPAKEARPLESSVERLYELLRAAGVSVEDPQGRPYVEGERMDVLLFEPQEGLERPVILQTVKPAVYRAGICVRTAEVIVGLPASDEDEAAEQALELEEAVPRLRPEDA